MPAARREAREGGRRQEGREGQAAVTAWPPGSLCHPLHRSPRGSRPACPGVKSPFLSPSEPWPARPRCRRQAGRGRLCGGAQRQAGERCALWRSQHHGERGESTCRGGGGRRPCAFFVPTPAHPLPFRAQQLRPSLPPFSSPPPPVACACRLQELVAVKQLRPDVLKGPDELKEFLTEANLLRKLRHRWGHRYDGMT